MTSHSALDRLREELARRGVDGFLIPRADAYQGETVAASDERLAWLTGFTGSAGVAIVLGPRLGGRATLFVDGRYEIQGAAQAEPRGFEITPVKLKKPADWLADRFAEHPSDGAMIAYDPWLHTIDEVERFEAAASAAGARMAPQADNPIDALWSDRPAPPASLVAPHPVAYSGEPAAEKRRRLAATLAAERLDAAMLAAPDGVCWLLNIRADDTPRTPLLRAHALLFADAAVSLFAEPAQFDAVARAHLQGDGSTPEVALCGRDGLAAAAAALHGKRVGVDRARTPRAAIDLIRAAGAEPVWREDPTLGPKARKNATELAGARAAQRRDGAALAATLAWIDRNAPTGALDELQVSDRLAADRRAAGVRLGQPLQDLSFDAIVGFGPNGAIVHYRVDADSSRPIVGDGLLLIDSGGQYRDGTTDVTRTVAIGAPGDVERAVFTRVLKGMIAVSGLTFPPKSAGRDVEAFGRAALWSVGLDFDHGLGHGVGSYLGVHEGPAGLSRRSGAPLEPGMILSNEPGCYREGAFGVRIENLLAVRAPAIPSPEGDREMLSFETLTLVPIDRRLIATTLLSEHERAWIDRYHARVLSDVGPLVDDETRAWLDAACAPL